MRVLLVGPPAERSVVRGQMVAARIEVVAEFATLDQARRSPLVVDAVVITPGTVSLSTADLVRSDRFDAEAGAEPLTARERHVLELLAEGLPNKAIALRLGISDQTVKFHVASICAKLDARNRTEAVRKAVRRGLITL